MIKSRSGHNDSYLKLLQFSRRRGHHHELCREETFGIQNQVHDEGWNHSSIFNWTYSFPEKVSVTDYHFPVWVYKGKFLLHRWKCSQFTASQKKEARVLLNKSSKGAGICNSDYNYSKCLHGSCSISCDRNKFPINEQEMVRNTEGNQSSLCFVPFGS